MQIDFDHAYKFCKEIAINHYENFPVGSLLIPSDKRKYIYSIYAFARFADDIADSDKFSKEEKLIRLNELNDELTKTEKNNLINLYPDTKYIFVALSNTIDELNIPVTEFRDLLTAFKQDSVKQRYDDFEELTTYSKFSANPIGHLVLYIFGYDFKKNAECFEYSNKICTALQLTNFWQDVSEDLKIGRIYIPEKIMTQFGYSDKMLLEKIENENFRNMIKFLTGETKILFNEGSKITGYVTGRLKLELKATIAGGLRILRKIENINYNVLSSRVKINNFDKIMLLGNIISE